MTEQLQQSICKRTFLGITGLISLFLAPIVCHAATITVNTQNMDIIDDSQCGLLEAVEAINQGGPFAGCSGPDGNDDRIVLPAGIYTTLEHLDIYRQVTIVGEGQNQTFIETGADYGFGVFQNITPNPTVLGLERLTLRIAPGAGPQAKGILVEGGKAFTTTLKLDHARVTGYSGDGITIDTDDPNDNEVDFRTFMYASNCLIDSNYAGIRSEGLTSINLVFCRITNNSDGGMVLVNGPHTKLWFSTVDSNTTETDGGGIFSMVDKEFEFTQRRHSQVEINYSTISNNEAVNNGGGIFFAGHKFDANHSTISGNHADGSGGGIYVASQTDYANYQYITVAFNDAGQGSGGIYQTAPGSGHLKLEGSIIANNTIAGNPAPSDFGTDLFAELEISPYKTIFGTKNGWVAICESSSDPDDCDQSEILAPELGEILDPNLGPLDFHGGPTRVHPLLPESPGSPGIDFMEALYVPGCNFDDFNSCTTEELYDQRGFIRPGNGDPIFGNKDWDVGAFELQCEGGGTQGPGCENVTKGTRPMNGKLLVTTQWELGYCMELQIENPNNVPTTDWLVNFNLYDSEIYDIWNLNTTGTTSAVTMTPTEDWNRVIPAGGASHSLGFCANFGERNIFGGAALSSNLPDIPFTSGVGVRAEFDEPNFDGKVFELQFVHSSLCLDAFNTFPGANVGQWTCHGGDNQRWRFNDRGNGYFELVDVRDNLCLDVVNGSTADGANIQVYTCNGTDAQQFTPLEVEPNTYQLKNKQSGKLVDVDGASTSNGTNVLQWPDNGGDNQKLIFTEMDGS